MWFLLIPQIYLALYWECLTLQDHLDPTPSNPQKIRVFSQNVYLLTDLVSDDSEEKMDSILKQIEGSDIVMLQEVWTLFSRGRRTRLVERAKKLGFPYSIGSKCHTLCDGMLLILSRYPIQGGTYTFKAKSGIEHFLSKGIVWASLDSPCPMYFFNTHLQAYGEDEVRLRQVEEIRKFIGDKPGVLAGDFNLNASDLNLGRNPIPPIPTWGDQGGEAYELLDFIFLLNRSGQGSVERLPYSDHSALRADVWC